MSPTAIRLEVEKGRSAQAALLLHFDLTLGEYEAVGCRSWESIAETWAPQRANKRRGLGAYSASTLFRYDTGRYVVIPVCSALCFIGDTD